MTEHQAKVVLGIMHETAVTTVASIQHRIAGLKEEQETHPQEDTAAYIRRLEVRVIRTHTEAQALAVALTKF